MKKLLTILLFCFIGCAAHAATYYFSDSQGDDSRTSTQAQNPNTAWKTITKLNSFFSSLSAGDNILFKRGDTFYGSIVTNKSGTLSNKITFNSYGTGAQPIISGLTAVTSWTNLGGGIYESNVLPTGSTVNMVLINGTEYAMGRTPNGNAANSGYLTFESHASGSITDNTNPFANTYSGAQLVVRTSHYQIEKSTITSVSGNTINYSPNFEAGLTNLYGFFVQNDIKTLDQYGEWYYNPSTHKISVYFGTSGTASVEVATQNLLMQIENDYIVVNNLHLKGANQYAVYGETSGVSNLIVKNCSIDYSGIDGVCLSGRHDFIFDSSTINYSNSNGISVAYQNFNPIVRNSTLRNTGTFQGMLIKDAREVVGLPIYSNEGLTATHNNIINTSYCGIYFAGSNNLIQNNYVDTFCINLDDGGGIYTYNYAPTGHPTIDTNNYITSNIILNGIGARNGTHESDPNYLPAEGIYLDNNTININVLNNTAAYCADMGIYLHDDSSFVVRGNVLFGNKYAQIGFQKDDEVLTFSGGQIKRNQLFSTLAYSPARILQINSLDNNVLTFATMDSNYYCRPFDTTNIIQTNWFGGATNNYHLSNWRTVSGQDAHTIQTPVPINSEAGLLLAYNETNVNKTINLSGLTYKSVTGNTYAGSITLTPFTSEILLRTPSDTVYYTYHIQHDTLERTTIAEKINHIGDSTVVLFDTSYFAQSIYKSEWIIDGSIIVTIPLFDTVPAHDTVFTCTQCASHDTTVVTISNHQVTIAADNQSKALGSTFTFTHTGNQVSVVGGSLISGDVITIDNAASSGASSGAASGSYPITLSSVTIMRGSTDVTSTYDVTYLNGTLAVASAIPLTIRADNQSKTYGQTLTFTHDASQVSITSGVLNTGDVITVDNAASTGSAANANVGTYSVSLSSVTIMNGATNVTANYAITYQAGSLTVTSAPLSIRANNEGKTAGQTFTFTNDGSQVSVTSGSLISGDAITADNAASAGAGSGASAGTYPITLSSVTITNGSTNVTSNYSISYQTGTLTVTAAALIITVAPKPQSKVYGSTFTFTNNGTQVNVVSGSLQSGDVITVDNAASSGAVSTANAGSYTITLSSITIMNGATNVTGNYTISYQTNTFTVNTKPITVKANNQTKAWNSTFTFTHNGSQVAVTSGTLVSGQAITVDNAASTGAISSANAGTYNITLSSITITSGATDVTSNYSVTYTAGIFTVTTIPITVKANNQSKVQGNAFTFSHDGTQVSVVSGSLLSGNVITVDNAASTGSSAGVPTGSYTITLSSVTITSGATNVTANYFITYQGGTLSVSASSTPLVYGMLPNEGAATIAQQLHTTKIYGNNGYRHKIDIESIGQWTVKQIRDSGLLSILTINSDPTASPIKGFPTGATLTSYLNKFDSLLTAHSNYLPDYLFIQNEESNPNYWSGKVQDYMAWLNGCITISHNHGVPCGNGGILTDVMYYIRSVYRDEGKTDSVNLITKLGNLPPGFNGTLQQAAINWYATEIPGITAGAADYINLHWYEPTSFIADNSDTTSGMLPIAIKFLASRTGKPVVTHEWGTKNPTQAFFNLTADQWKNNGVRFMVYYDGTGPVADAHPEFWKAWILMQ